MAYFYLSETAKFDYKVTVKPAPADGAKAVVHRGTKDGDAIYSDESLATEGKGTFELDMAKLAVTDSPVFVEFVFSKDGNDQTQVKSITLAEASPSKITVPKTAKLGDEVELKVAGWSALVYSEAGAEPKAAAETNKKRLGDAPESVKWQVDGEDLDGTGESVKLKIEDKHLGKELAVEAYLGTAAGRAKGTIKVYKLDALDPVGDTVKQWVNLKADKAANQGREVEVTATVTPAEAGVTVNFALDEDLGARLMTGENGTALKAKVAPKLSAKSAKTDKEGKAKIKLTLSNYGGDKDRVLASLSADPKPDGAGVLATRWFETWRALYLKLDGMKRKGGGSYGSRADKALLTSTFASHFVELRPAGEDAAPEYRELVKSGKEAVDLAKSLRTGVDGKTPLIHMLFVGAYGWDPKAQEFDANIAPDGQSASYSVVLNDFVLDPADFVTKISWDDSKQKKKGTLPKTAATYTYDEDTNLLTVKIDTSAVSLTGEPGWAGVRITLKCYTEGYGEALSGPANFISVHKIEKLARSFPTLNDENGNPRFSNGKLLVDTSQPALLAEADVVNAFKIPIIHEPCHLLGLAATGFPEAKGTRPAGEVKNDHGWHCFKDEPKCLMFREFKTERGMQPKTLCTSCQDALRGRDLVKIDFGGSTPF